MIYVGIIGAGSCDPETFKLAEEVGYKIGEAGWFLVCGGLGGVMEAASKGCVEAGGITIGILPGRSRSDANPYIKVAIPTGLGEGRNILVVRASDILVAISGGYGTLSEIGFALKTGKPVLGLNTWEGIKGIHYLSATKELVEDILKILNRQ